MKLKPWIDASVYSYKKHLTRHEQIKLTKQNHFHMWHIGCLDSLIKYKLMSYISYINKGSLKGILTLAVTTKVNKEGSSMMKKVIWGDIAKQETAGTIA